MPVRRAKSCYNCRIAKVRCSLASPCSRCAKRQLECNYASAQPRHSEKRSTGGFRPIKPASEPSPVHRFELVSDRSKIDRICDKETKDDHNVTGQAVQDSSVASIDPEMLIAITDHVPSSFERLGVFEQPYLPYYSDLGTHSFGFTKAFDMPDILDLSEFVDYCPDRSATQQTKAISAPCSLNASSTCKALGPQLSQRARSLQQGSLTAKMILSRLTDFTRNMADGRQLPPFIYPPCGLGSVGECTPDSPHQCLSEKLSICLNLTQMFSSRLPGSHSFVWQQICTHIRQMRKEYENYDEQGMLEALQVLVVYGMLCSQCTESVSAQEASTLVATIENFGKALYATCPWGFDVDHLYLSRNKWVTVESLRRVGAFLYLIDLLLNSNARTPYKGHCDEFFDMPLPCARDLWQPISDREWKRRYDKDMATKQQRGHGVLSLRNMLRLRQSSQFRPDTSATDDVADGFVEWCERADDLSMLLWMSLTVEG